ncbi:LysE family translocator [Paenibacillus sp. y28]|uniref:LysE family translocator n=1 Tax=Paenibacillus sp. y28 TaxID=3129110 RepID=UPI003019842D
MELFIKSVVIGFSIAAPVGPVGLLCIRRSLLQGRRFGFVSGLGAATADTLYGGAAAFGFTMIAPFLLAHRGWIQLLGGVFLLILGIHFMRSRPAEPGEDRLAGGLLSSYISAFLLTAANPLTIWSFIGIFAGVGMSGKGGLAAVLLVSGVFTGSLLWWMLLTTGMELIKRWMSQGMLHWVNRIAGLGLVVLGAVSVINVAAHWLR